MAVDLGTGTTVTHAAFTGNVTNISWSGIGRETVDISHLGSTGFKEFLAGDLADPGEITIEGQFEGDVATVNDVASNLVITLPDAATITVSAFCIGFDFDIPLEEVMTFTATFKATGAIS